MPKPISTMAKDVPQPFKIVLASGSPRRQLFFKEMGLKVEIRVKEIEENYPTKLRAHEIPDYLARLKADAFINSLSRNEILITSDTVVWHANKALGKPVDRDEAIGMLGNLSDNWHEVITSVCFTTLEIQKIVNHTTKVKFRALTTWEIEYYIDKYQPFDKAGGYGIQEWIGLIAIEEIHGSYANVVGLPTHLVYTTLHGLMGQSLLNIIEKRTES